MRARVGDSAPPGRSGPVADFVEAAAGASPTAVTDTLTLDLTASFQRRSLSRCTVEGTVENSHWCVRGGAHQDLKRETPVIAQQGLDGVEVEHELREAAGSVRLGQMLIPWQRQEGAASHLRERGLSSLVWCLQRGEDPACGQDKQGGQQTGALVASGTAQPGVLIPRPGDECDG